MTATKLDQKIIEFPESFTVHAVIAKFSFQAVWLDSEVDTKGHLLKMIDSVSAHYGKSRLEVSINDFHALATKIQRVAASAGLAEIKIGDAVNLVNRAASIKAQFDIVSYLYYIADLILAGQVAGLAIKLMAYVAVPRVKQASITYIVGLLAAELYKSDEVSNVPQQGKSSLKTEPEPDEFDPIFMLFDREHLTELSKFLKLDCKISLTDIELKQAIADQFNFFTKHRFVYLFHKMSPNRLSYRQILEIVCRDLKIDLPESSGIVEMEQKIVFLVLQETIDHLSKSQQEELLVRLSKVSGAEFDYKKVAAGGSIAALIIGNYAGFGTYLAASSALGALTSGLGITASFGVYTAMSSTIALALGPLGLGAATAAFIALHAKSEPSKAIPAILYIAAMRAKLQTGVSPVPIKENEKNSIYVLIAAIGIACTMVGYLIGRFIH